MGWEHGGTSRDLQLVTSMVAKARAVILVTEPPAELAMQEIQSYFDGKHVVLDRTVRSGVKILVYNLLALFSMALVDCIVSDLRVVVHMLHAADRFPSCACGASRSCELRSWSSSLS